MSIKIWKDKNKCEIFALKKCWKERKNMNFLKFIFYNLKRIFIKIIRRKIAYINREKAVHWFMINFTQNSSKKSIQILDFIDLFVIKSKRNNRMDDLWPCKNEKREEQIFPHKSIQQQSIWHQSRQLNIHYDIPR